MLTPPIFEPAAASLYAETARPAPLESPLDGDVSVKVAIVGGGYTGLSAALHLAEAGVEALVIEANSVGFGASGRNGGQVNPGLKWEPERLESVFGADLGGRMVRLGSAAPDLVFELIAKHQIDCEAHRGGTIRAGSAHKAASIRAHVEQWAARGADIKLLDGDAISRATGARAYAVGSLDRRGGNLNPLGLARGLAEAAVNAGARIATTTRAMKLERQTARWRLITSRGTVSSYRVMIATNGYSDDLWPALRRTVVPVFSSIVATEALSPEFDSILPGRASLYELSASHAYYRRDAYRRFLIGGRSVMRPTSNIAEVRGLIDHARALFPALAGVRWRHPWNGRVAVTWDELPHVHEPVEGLTIALGYNGRGVAMATAVGRMLARRVSGGPAEAMDLPVTRIAPIPFHFAWPLAATARLKWDQAKERFAV